MGKNKIGVFQGIPCYKMNFEDYIALEHKSEKEIYIINGDMVLNNRVIGYYDGKVVTEYHEPYEVYIEDKQKEVEVKPQVEFLDADKLLEQVYNLKLEV